MTKRKKQTQAVVIEPVEVKPEPTNITLKLSDVGREFMLGELRTRFEIAKLAGRVDEMIAILDEVAQMEKVVG
jgi:hypothetical protein